MYVCHETNNCWCVCGVRHSLAYLSDVCYILLETRRSPGPSQSPHSFVLCATKKYLRFPRLIIFPPQSLPDVSSVVPIPMATEVPAVVVPFCGACPGSWHYCKPRGAGERHLRGALVGVWGVQAAGLAEEKKGSLLWICSQRGS